MSLVGNEITNLQNQTAFNQVTPGMTKASDTSDSNMFLRLMLQQLQCQDPTQPTDNTEWLSQLAQYSSLEQMASMNSGLNNCMQYMQAMYSDMSTNSEINQTLSMIGKEVTLQDPENEENKISGRVTEASFEDGTGKIKVGDAYYSIANIISIKE